MTEQCKIYLDPWDKADLEGTAMLINRMPDIGERTYRGVTCQRWLVRFQPDQDNAMRWLDYGDAETYVYPHLAPHALTLGSTEIILNDASPILSFPTIHGVTAKWYASNHLAAFQQRETSWLLGYSLVYTVQAATGGSALTSISFRRGDVQIHSVSMANSTTVGGPYFQSWTWSSPFSIAPHSFITAGFTGPQPAGESIQLTNIIIALFLAWQT